MFPFLMTPDYQFGIEFAFVLENAVPVPPTGFG
jgi:hypothetical protein